MTIQNFLLFGQGTGGGTRYAVHGLGPYSVGTTIIGAELDLVLLLTDSNINAARNIAGLDLGLALEIELHRLFLTMNGITLMEQFDRIEQLLRNRIDTNPDTGVAEIYNDAGDTVIFRANLKENVAGTQDYRGQGAERRDRFEDV